MALSLSVVEAEEVIMKAEEVDLVDPNKINQNIIQNINMSSRVLVIIYILHQQPHRQLQKPQHYLLKQMKHSSTTSA